MLGKGRLEAFSDGVIAILITIMVLELRPPEGHTLRDLVPLWPKLLAYVLSFVYLGIYWNNHHHLLTATKRITGAAMWANLHLLFWLSLVPAVTDWAGESHFAPTPMACYGATLLLSAAAFTVFERTLLRVHGPASVLARSMGRRGKENVSLVLYAVGVLTAFVSPWLSGGAYTAVALIWLVPDRRIERELDSVEE